VDFLKGHGVEGEHRARMVDWMIQVFRVLKRSQDKTFFLAVSILDRFFAAMQKMKLVISKQDLHIFGVVAIFISSKVEDVIPIFMNDILKSAAHGKFTQAEIIQAEQTML
jgi:hypothetical protein